MFEFLLVVIIITGIFNIYLSNKHQILLAKKLAKTFRFIGYALVLLTLPPWISIFSTATAIFLWLTIIMTTLVLVPFCCFILVECVLNDQKQSQ